MSSECRTLGVHESKTLEPQPRSKRPRQGIGRVGGNPTKGMYTGEHTSCLWMETCRKAGKTAFACRRDSGREELTSSYSFSAWEMSL